MTQLLPRLVATILNREAIQNLGSAWQNLVPNLTRIESDSDSIRFVFAIRQRAPPAMATSVSGYTSSELQSTNHSVQAVTMAAQRAGNWARSNLSEATQNLNRFPIQIRRDQARQQSSAGTARAQRAGNWEQNNLLEATQNLNRFPIQIRRDQARQQSSAGTARRGDNRQRAPPALPTLRVVRRLSRKLQVSDSGRTYSRIRTRMKNSRKRRRSSAWVIRTWECPCSR